MCADKTTANPNTVLIGLTATEVLGPNPKRKAIIFTPIPSTAGAAGAISLSFRGDVTVGGGMLNYLAGQFNGTVLSDRDIGSVIGLPIFGISGTTANTVQITEILYE